LLRTFQVHLLKMEPFKILRPVLPQELLQDKVMLGWLQRSMEDDPLSIRVEDLIDDIYNKVSLVWTWGTGILVTTLEERTQGWVCIVTNVCGEKYLQNLGSIEQDVESYARHQGCKYLLGDVPSPGLVKIYEKLGATTFHRVLREIQ